jgi:predicted GNAT family N-acyltransferase
MKQFKALPLADFRVEPADYKTDFRDLRIVREQVFVAEQKVPIELELDDLDQYCQHVIARDDRNRPIGTGRLTPQQKIGRMAVLPEWRGKGVGDALLQALIERAQQLGWQEVSLNSQLSALGFYEKHGFVSYGEQFEEAGIQHRSMKLTLQLIARNERPNRPSLLDRSQEFEGLNALLDITQQVIRSARKTLWIYSRDLEPVLFANSAVMDALREFAVNSRGGSAHILIQNLESMRSQSHPLLPLAQRLSSVFHFATPIEPEDAHYPSAFVVSDGNAYVFRLLDGRYEGDWSPDLPARCRQLRDVFGQFWARSRPCTELRALGI